MATKSESHEMLFAHLKLAPELHKVKYCIVCVCVLGLKLLSSASIHISCIDCGKLLV